MDTVDETNKRPMAVRRGFRSGRANATTLRKGRALREGFGGKVDESLENWEIRKE